MSNVKPGQLRCGEHTDWGAITLLIQDDVGGLEVKKATVNKAKQIKIIVINKEMFLLPFRFISWGRLFFTYHLLLEMLEWTKTNTIYFQHQFFYNPA